MYLLAILGVILSVLLMGLFSPDGMASLSSCLDLFALLLIIVIVIPVMAAMGMLKDLNHAFRLTLGRKAAGELRELKRAKTAMVYLIRCVVLAGVTGTLAGVMQVLSFGAEEMTTLTASLGVAICPLLYAFVIAIVLLPIEARLEQKIVEFMENEE
jgi:hypothetical protein